MASTPAVVMPSAASQPTNTAAETAKEAMVTAWFLRNVATALVARAAACQAVLTACAA